MDDKAIIELYFARSEKAISETAVKYGGYCYSIAHNILLSKEDAEESVNDTYLAAWNTMPPRYPSILATFLGKITRYISLDRWKSRSAYKRGGGEVTLALEELDECLSGGESAEQVVEKKELLNSINRFLDTLPETQRNMFVCRYWYLEPVQQIADRYGFTLSKTASILRRTRMKLSEQLRKEGFL